MIDMEIKEITGKLVLREQRGEGMYGEDKVVFSIDGSGKSFIVDINDKMFSVTMTEIVEEVYKHYQAKKKASESD